MLSKILLIFTLCFYSMYSLAQEVQVVWVASKQELHAHFKSLLNQSPPNYLQAFAWTNEENSKCIIFSPKPRGEGDHNRLMILGHELFHCTDGAYHGTMNTFIRK